MSGPTLGSRAVGSFQCGLFVHSLSDAATGGAFVVTESGHGNQLHPQVQPLHHGRHHRRFALCRMASPDASARQGGHWGAARSVHPCREFMAERGSSQLVAWATTAALIMVDPGPICNSRLGTDPLRDNQEMRKTVAVSSGSPTVRRRRLAAALRRLRDQSGMTADQAAREIGISKSALSRIENAQVSAMPPVARALLELYGVEGADVDALVQVAREARPARFRPSSRRSFRASCRQLTTPRQ